MKTWDLNGKLPARRPPTDHRYDTDEAVDRFLGVERPPEPRQTVVYCRVFRQAQQDDLRS